MVRPDGPRDLIAGPDTPEAPFPLKVRGPVIRGFGRGSKDLGIPTANIPLSGLSIDGSSDLSSGIYYGWCRLDHSTTVNPDSAYPSNAESTTSTCSSSHAVQDLSYPSGPADSNAILPTVLSIGYNPFYNNTHRSVEIHIMHSFPQDFYGASLSLMILGFIRPEYDYVSKEALVKDIREDIRVARRSLDRDGYERWKEDAWLNGDE